VCLLEGGYDAQEVPQVESFRYPWMCCSTRHQLCLPLQRLCPLLLSEGCGACSSESVATLACCQHTTRSIEARVQLVDALVAPVVGYCAEEYGPTVCFSTVLPTSLRGVHGS